MTIGERIKYLRIEKNLSQDDLAAMVGYTNRTTIAKIESGQRELRQSKIKQFAEALGVSPMYLLGLDEKKSALPDDDNALNAMIIERFAMLTPQNRLEVLEFLEQKLRSQGSK